MPTLASGIFQDGDLLPGNLAVITSDNFDQLTELARWGKGAILELAYAPDGSQVAAVTGQGVYFYEIQSYKLMRFLPLPLTAGPLAFSPSLRYLAEGSDHGIIIWELETGEAFRQFQTGSEWIEALAFTPNERQIFATVDFSSSEETFWKMYTWDIQENRLIRTWDQGGPALAFSADGRTFATLEEGKIILWKYDRVTPWRVITDADDYFVDFALSPDGQLLALVPERGEGDSFVQVWDLMTDKLLQEFYLRTPEHSEAFPTSAALKVRASEPKSPRYLSGPGRYSISDLTFSPDSQILAARNGFGLLHQWRLQDNVLLRVDRTNGGRIIYSPGGETLVSLGYTAEFRQARGGALLYILGNHTGSISQLDFAPDGHSIAAGSLDKKVWWRRTQDGIIIRTLKTSETVPQHAYFSNWVYGIDFAENGSFIAAGTYDGGIFLWSVSGGEPQLLTPSCEYLESIRRISLSLDSQYLAASGYEGGVNIFNLKNGSSVCEGGWVTRQVAFSPAVPLLAMYDFETEKVTLYHMPSMEVYQVLGEGAGDAPPVFSSDGKLLAINADRQVVEVWNVETGTLATRITNEHWVESLAFSPDGRMLVISEGSGLAAYDAHRGTLLYHMDLSQDWLYSITFSPDGRLLAAGGDAGIVRLFGVTP